VHRQFKSARPEFSQAAVLWRRFDRALTVTRTRTVGSRAVNIQVKQNLDITIRVIKIS